MDRLAKSRSAFLMTTNTRTHTPQPILVLGGTGKTGRRVAARVAARGVPIRIGSRSAEPRFDWEHESTWAAALDGIAAAYVTYVPDLAMPGAAEQVARFAAVAKERGVRRLVLLSGRGEEGARAAELAVEASGLEWTIVTASWFNQNFSEDYLLPAVLQGELALPAGDVAEPFIDADDIADVAVAALLEEAHAGQRYEVTGPRLLTFTQVAATIASVTGRPIEYFPVTTSDFVAGAAEQGMPQELAAMLADLMTEVLDGRNAHVSDGVQRALGRPPRDFVDYAIAAANTGIWNTETSAEGHCRVG
jgi:uncharacterized protein YbjT (DUF2867 family)